MSARNCQDRAKGAPAAKPDQTLVWQEVASPEAQPATHKASEIPAMHNKNAHSVPNNNLAHVSLGGVRVAPRKGIAQAHQNVYWPIPQPIRSASPSMAELFQMCPCKIEGFASAPASSLRWSTGWCAILINNDGIGLFNRFAQEQFDRKKEHQLMEGCVADPLGISGCPANVTAVGFEPTPFRTGA